MEELCLVPSSFLPLFNTFISLVPAVLFFLVSLFILELFCLFFFLLSFSSRPLLRLWLHNLSAIFHFSVSWLELLKYSRASTAHHLIQDTHTHTRTLTLKHNDTALNTYFCIFLSVTHTHTRYYCQYAVSPWNDKDEKSLLPPHLTFHFSQISTPVEGCARTYTSAFSNVNKERSQMNIYA